MEQLANTSLKTNMPSYQSILDKAMAFYYADDIENARALSDELLRMAPRDYPTLHLAGIIARSQKRLPESAEFLKQALMYAPDPQSVAASWCALGKTLRQAGDLRQAEEALRRALHTDPTVCGYATELAKTYADGWKADLAIETLRKAIGRHPRDPAPYISLGSILTKYDRQNDALAIHDLALVRIPNDAQLHLQRGVTLKMLGRFKEAETEVSEALRLDQTLNAYSQLVQLKTLQIDAQEIAVIKKQWDSANNAPVPTRIDAGFALAKIYNDAKDYDVAFQYLESANRLKRTTISFSIEEQENEIDGIMALFTQDYFERYSGKSTSDLAPIFILGMPRSGTTLIEQILASHSNVRGGGELECMGIISTELGETWGGRGDMAPGSDETVAKDLSLSATRYAEMTAHLWRNGARFTDKMPMNYLYIGVIDLLFPKANIIYCRRNPVATCFSCYQHLFNAGNIPYSYDLTELGQYYKIHEKIMHHWKSILPSRILEVKYETLIRNIEEEIRRILTFCGLDYESACLDFHNLNRPIKTASLMQVRKPVYKEAVDHWKNYQLFLKPLLDALGTDHSQIGSS
ncbi:MAG: sulfotransferase [Gammaproteobacteria bacterium]